MVARLSAAACCRCSHFLCSRDVSYCDIATIAPTAFIGMKDLSTLYVWWMGGVVGRVMVRGGGRVMVRVVGGEVGRGDGEGGGRGEGEGGGRGDGRVMGRGDGESDSEG